MRKAAIGLAVLGSLMIALPAIAQTPGTIEISLDGTVRGQPGEIVRVHTETVPESMIGWSCSGTASTENNASEHDGNNFLFTSGSSTASILDWEAVAGATTTMSGTLVLGSTITIDLELGPGNGVQSVSSGGVLIVLTCAQPEPPTTTTTTITTTTTTQPPTVTTTTTPQPPTVTTTTAPPPGVTTTTVPPPEGGVAAGGGGTAGRGNSAVPWLTAGAAALFAALALLAGGQRRASRRE
jgi:hypothetical protein